MIQEFLIVVVIVILAFLVGYMVGHLRPERGEIIYWVLDPHKCKGIPKRGGWNVGTQWKCHECGDVWELKETYDGIETGSEWKRIKTAPAKTEGKKAKVTKSER